MITYAIGDIHGCLTELLMLMQKIEAHIKTHGKSYRIITCGDYIDRGPDSKGVLDFLMARPDIIKLRGNHEDMLLTAQQGHVYFDDFRSNGGGATLRSFGLSARSMTDVSLIPEKYFDFIKNETRMYFEDDLRAYVHAGIDPTLKSMAVQKDSTLLWTREPFLSYPTRMFKYIVHGHTPLPNSNVNIRENRCNLDTGCVFGQALSCAIFDDKQEKPIALGTVPYQKV